MHCVTRLPESRIHKTTPTASPSNVVQQALFSGTLTLASLIFCCCSSLLQAQVAATLSGVITDSSGAAVSGATVVAKSVDTGISRPASTDSSGHYRFFALPVGVYKVIATKEGFAETVRVGISLAVGQDANADLRLRIGQVKEQVQVTEDAPVVNLTTQDISGL